MRRRNPTSLNQFSSNQNHSGEAVSIWRDLHQRLNQLAKVQNRSESLINPSSSASSSSSSSSSSKSKSKSNLSLNQDDLDLNKIESLFQETEEEDAILDICLERLGILIALREAPPDPPSQGRLAKKRRLDQNGSTSSLDRSNSPAPPGSSSSNTINNNSLTTTATTNDSQGIDSPVGSRTSSSPVPSQSQPQSQSQTQHHQQQPSSNVSTTSLSILNQTKPQLLNASSSSRLGTPSSDSGNPSTSNTLPNSNGSGSNKKENTLSNGSSLPATRAVFKLDRRITHKDQLPLLPGRLVAFRRPKKPSESSGIEEWIMAKVVKCISGDKNRYEVQDVDDESKGGKQNSWNTTLKSVIPLPVRDSPESYPPVPLLPGTPVLGLYPETTSFYRGTIKSGPTEKGRKYKVFFEDDEETGAVSVVMENVVPII